MRAICPGPTGRETSAKPPGVLYGAMRMARCGDFSELTIQIECARNDARESAPKRKVLEPLSGTRPVVARNLTFEDRRHARTSRIDFLAVRQECATSRLSGRREPVASETSIGRGSGAGRSHFPFCPRFATLCHPVSASSCGKLSYHANAMGLF